MFTKILIANRGDNTLRSSLLRRRLTSAQRKLSEAAGVKLPAAN
jgi:hypothetical protein